MYININISALFNNMYGHPDTGSAKWGPSFIICLGLF